MGSFRAPVVPAERDAMVLYSEAIARFKPFSDRDWFVPLNTAMRLGWPKATPEIRSWLDENRGALALWRQAAERPDVRLRRPDDPDTITGPWLAAPLMLAQLEASRLEAAGEMAAPGAGIAPRCDASPHPSLRPAPSCRGYRAIVPTDRQGGHYTLGNRSEDQPVARARLWMKFNRSAARTLAVPMRQARICLDHARPRRTAARRRGPSMGRLRSEGDDQLWYNHVPLFHESRWFARNEPQRSRRVARLAFANWVANCERTSALWPKPAPMPPGQKGPELFLLNDPEAPGPPAPIKGVSAAEVDEWYKTTLLLPRFFNAGRNTFSQVYSHQLYVAWRRDHHANLILSLAEELYARDHGGQLPATPELLVGPYLKALPDGIVESAVTRMPGP